MVTSQQAVSRPVGPGTPELEALIVQIDENVLARDRNREAPLREFDLVRQARLGAMRIPVRRGGAGSTLRELFETVIALAAADPDLAHSLRNHYLHVESRLVLHQDSDDVWLERAAEGAIFGVVGSEPGSGSAGQVSTRYDTTLAPTPGGYLLNGTKHYSTGALYADWIVVTAGDPDGQSVQVIVPGDRQGVLHDDDWDGIGQRLTGSGTTRFHDVWVDADEILPDSRAWTGIVPYPATFPQLYLTSVVAGILRRVTRDAVDLVHGRERTYYHAPSERPAADVLLQESVGYIAANAYVAEAAVLRAADELDVATGAVLAGRPDRERSLAASLAAAKTKVVIDKIALETATMIFDVGGATAVRARKQLDRHWRNIRTLASHNPRAYKAKWIGDYELNQTPFPSGAYF